MLKSLKSSQTIVYLLTGYTISAGLFLLSWFVSESQINDHVVLIHSSEQAAQKMNVIASLIEIARTRTRLSHEMMFAEDVFERDKISQAITALASDFIKKRSELLALELSEEERQLIEAQQQYYPIVINNLDRIAELSVEDTESSILLARTLLMNKVMPTQEIVIDGFMRLMEMIEEDVRTGSQSLYLRHKAHNETRYLTMFIILGISAIVMYLVIRNILKIETRLYKLSTSDALTGVLNRRSFDQRIQQEWKRALRSQEPLTLLFIDVDYFKKYNDVYGHQEGDRALVRIASLLSGFAHRSSDSVSRYGGEEFAIILPGVDEAGAKTVAERLLERVRMENIPHQGSDISEHVTVSIGQATMTPQMEGSYELLIKASDHALYQSKRSGRDRLTSYTPEKEGEVVELFSKT
jgi:diguanylate cyclase (GGDEF)-like protein